MINQANINSLWASLIVEELIRLGINNFSVSPGSRSTPLAIAVAENEKANVIVHFDERGAGYYALGQARASGLPSVLICTSGTAVANFFPSVVEAAMASVPMIILSADRPPELRHTGANQTIDQVEIFGKYPRFFHDLQPPTTDLPASDLLQLIDTAVKYSQTPDPGPVHINCMFREPLVPTDDGKNYGSYLSQLDSFESKHISDESIGTIDKLADELTARIKKHDSGLILIGNLPAYQSKNDIVRLVNRLGWPVLCDITSGLRFSSEIKNRIVFYDQILLADKDTDLLKTDCMLHLGGSFVSKRLLQFLDRNRPSEYIQVQSGSIGFDPNHQVTKRLTCNPEALSERVINKLDDYKTSSDPVMTLTACDQLDQKYNELLNNHSLLTEPAVARMISQYLPKSHALFLASSMTIRQFDMYGIRNRSDMIVSSNRGTSGIDGTLATAVGFANGLNRPVTVVIGDMAMLHDLNSLSLIKQLTQPITIVILNNNGGRIFEQLPIAEFTDQCEQFFVAPTEISFQKVAEMFDIEYSRTDSSSEFLNCYKNSILSSGSTILELSINPKTGLTERTHLDKIVKETLNQKGN